MSYKKIQQGQAAVVHVCKASYSGGRDEEDCSSRPALANSSRDPISKILNTARRQWLTTVILATEDAEITGISVQS
jgi:hypothetical protein